MKRRGIYEHYQSRRLQQNEPHGGKLHCRTGYLKTRLCTGTCHWFFPVGTYQELIRRYESGELDFSKVTSINLDEYKGLSPENDQSYRYFMNTNLFDHINIDKARTHVPNGLEENAEKACADYNALIEQCGGIDLQLLGSWKQWAYRI